MHFPEPILTLEPFLEAVREGLELAGWTLSGMQKTTSYEFEGRWVGDSSRSAYLFFHREGIPDWVTIDVFLDETSQGLKGNLALVLEGPELAEVEDPGVVLADLAAAGRNALPEGYKTPITLRYRMPDLESSPGISDTEVRFKLYVPRAALEAGHSAVAALATTTARAFHELLGSSGLGPFLATE